MKGNTNALAFMAAGLLMLAFGFYLMFFETKGYEKTTAVIERIEEYGSLDDEMHDVYVRYSVNGNTYDGMLDYYSPGYQVGKEIPIYYNPDNPEQIHGESRGMQIFLIAAGPVVFVLGTVDLFRRRG